ncbi:MAG: histidinol-phosphate transaminase [Anaerolineae bacterium]
MTKNNGTDNFVDLVRTDVGKLAPYTPGTYYTDLAARLGRDPAEMVKLDANENPYGPPPAALQALSNLRTPHRYPEPECRRLRRALSSVTDVPVEQLLVGAGSDELLRLTTQLLIEPGDAVVNCPPTFGMYAFFAALAGARVVDVPRHADFSLDVDAIEAAVHRERPKLLFVCSPNNPTGTLTGDADLCRLLDLPVIVLLDEAYVEFSDWPSRMTWAPERDNLIIVRTLSKWGGLAGLRVGYGAFPAALMPHLWKIKEPYTVSAAAEAAACAALTDLDTLNERRDRIVAERERLLTQLARIPYLTPIPSHANFIYCKIKERDPQALRAGLEAQGILLRWYDGKDVVRISVGTPEQNDQLVAALGV